MFKFSVDSGTLDTLIENMAKPVHDGIVRFFKEISAVLDQSAVSKSTQRYLMQQAISMDQEAFFVLLDRVYASQHDLGLVWSLKMLHDLCHDHKIKYLIGSRGAEVNAVTYCARIDTQKTESQKMQMLRMGLNPLLDKLIRLRFSRVTTVYGVTTDAMQKILSSPCDFTWRLQTWLHGTVDVHLTHPDKRFVGIELDQATQAALRSFVAGEFDHVQQTLQSQAGATTANTQSIRQALLVASHLMRKKISAAAKVNLDHVEPTLLGAIFQLSCSALAKNVPGQNAWQVLAMCHDGKQFLHNLFSTYPTLLSTIHPKTVWHLVPKHNTSLLYWLCTDLEIRDFTDEVNEELRKNPPFGIFHNLTVDDLKIPASQRCGFERSSVPGTTILLQLLQHNPSVVECASASVLTSSAQNMLPSVLGGCSALQLLCADENGVRALLLMLQANAQLRQDFATLLYHPFKKSMATKNSSLAADECLEKICLHESAWQALCATPVGRQVLRLIFSHQATAIQTLSHPIPLRAMLEDISCNISNETQAQGHYMQTIQIQLLMQHFGKQSDCSMIDILAMIDTNMCDESLRHRLHQDAYLLSECVKVLQTRGAPCFKVYRQLLLDLLTDPDGVFKHLGLELGIQTQGKAATSFNALNLVMRKVLVDSKKSKDASTKEKLTALFRTLRTILNAYNDAVELKPSYSV